MDWLQQKRMLSYPSWPPSVLLGLVRSLLVGERRSFRQDALRCTRNLHIHLKGGAHIPTHGPGVILVNHYYRPGFFAGWIALAVSTAVPAELTWVMTSAWTAAGTLGSLLKAALSERLFPRLAQVYGFIPMPPMPPRPQDVAARAQAVRRVLSVTSRSPQALIAMAPEGQDSPGGVLMRPHPGVGRLLAHLEAGGMSFHPVGIYEETTALVVHFGAPFRLNLSKGLSTTETDRLSAEIAMCRIAALLPQELRGTFGES